MKIKRLNKIFKLILKLFKYTNLVVLKIKLIFEKAWFFLLFHQLTYKNCKTILFQELKKKTFKLEFRLTNLYFLETLDKLEFIAKQYSKPLSHIYYKLSNIYELDFSEYRMLLHFKLQDWNQLVNIQI